MFFLRDLVKERYESRMVIRASVSLRFRAPYPMMHESVTPTHLHLADRCVSARRASMRGCIVWSIETPERLTIPRFDSG